MQDKTDLLGKIPPCWVQGRDKGRGKPLPWVVGVGGRWAKEEGKPLDHLSPRGLVGFKEKPRHDFRNKQGANSKKQIQFMNSNGSFWIFI